MTRRGLVLAGAAVVLAAAAASALPLARAYWRAKSSNPVRRGIAVAERSGCFSCHGPMGSEGIPDPGSGEAVPQWSGGVFMMYVKGEEEVRQFVRNGVSDRMAKEHEEGEEHEKAAIEMPAFRDVLSDGEIDDAVAAFLVLSGMKRPPDGTPEARGRQVAREHRCESCHAPGGAGGRPNPGSFTGFVPGWYGADFEDLVRSREEFDDWITKGKIERLETNPLARRFTRRQRLKMPEYASMTKDDRDALWAYAQWLGKTRGGLDGPTAEY